MRENVATKNRTHHYYGDQIARRDSCDYEREYNRNDTDDFHFADADVLFHEVGVGSESNADHKQTYSRQNTQRTHAQCQ